MVIEWIAIVLSLVAIGFSIWTWIKLRPDDQRESEGTSMDILTNLLINKKIKYHKRDVSFWYWNRKERGLPIYFENTKYSEKAHELENAFNQASLLYEQDSVDKERFRELFGGTLVRFWRILGEEILRTQISNPDFCSHFQKVAKELMDKYKIVGEPYETKPFLHET